MSNIFTFADLKKKEKDKRQLYESQEKRFNEKKIEHDKIENEKLFNDKMSEIVKNLYVQILFYKKLYASKCVEFENYKLSNPSTNPNPPSPFTSRPIESAGHLGRPA
jgi:hypothetical protein